jgi:putative resolvase
MLIYVATDVYRSLVVAEAGEQKLDLVQDFIDVVTSMCARIYGRRAASNRAKKALAAAQEEP